MQNLYLPRQLRFIKWVEQKIIEAEISYQDFWVQKYDHCAKILMQKEQVTVTYTHLLKRRKSINAKICFILKRDIGRLSTNRKKLIRNVLFKLIQGK